MNRRRVKLLSGRTVVMAKNLNTTVSDIKNRIIRFEDLVPCKTAFIDAKTPGSDKKENFCLIGGGVAENPDQHVHIQIPHGFDIGAARQPKGCKNSHHSHDTEEVFVVHKGSWKFTWGHDGSDGEAVLGEGDTISIPTHTFRGFENVGQDDGFLFAILGLYPDGTAGNVTWAPYVFEEAKSYGLVLLNDGRLIDKTIGEKIPGGVEEISPLSMSELQEYQTLSLNDMMDCVLQDKDLTTAPTGGLACLDGVQEYAVVGEANAKERIAAGKMGWTHSFQQRRIQIDAGATTPKHSRAEEEVLFVHRGSLQVTTPLHSFILNQGDVFTVPIGLKRSFENVSDITADLIVVRGSHAPDAATML